MSEVRVISNTGSAFVALVIEQMQRLHDRISIFGLASQFTLYSGVFKGATEYVTMVIIVASPINGQAFTWEKTIINSVASPAEDVIKQALTEAVQQMMFGKLTY